ncbi:MAG: helix-hairpin-helix domain-containing protein [Anaerolineae bacterium]
MNWVIFCAGVIIGWIGELFIDFLFWRHRHFDIASELEVRADLAAMEARAGQLEAQVIGLKEDRTHYEYEMQLSRDTLARVHEQLAAREAEIRQLQALLADAHRQLAEQTSSRPIMPASESHGLEKIEGIGPKISKLLNARSIYTLADLAEANVEELQQCLAEAGPQYQMVNPATWPEQARLAVEGNWEALDALQTDLKGGRA